MGLFDKAAYDAAEANAGGEFSKMGAGGYVCRVQAVRTRGQGYGGLVDYVADKQYVKLIFDVDEGEHAGRFSDEYWAGEDKDWGHTFYLSWKNLGAFKNAIQCLDESNPGFDAYAAADAEQWGLFIGKQLGLVFGEEEYTANDGTIKTKLTLPRIKSVQDIRDGRFKVPELKKLQASTAAPAAAANDDDVPFFV